MSYQLIRRKIELKDGKKVDEFYYLGKEGD